MSPAPTWVLPASLTPGLYTNITGNVEIEGHADNAAACLSGGLVAVATDPMTGQPALAPACPLTAGKLEYFLAGTEPPAACVVRPATTPARPDSSPADSVSLDSLLLGEPIESDSTQTR